MWVVAAEDPSLFDVTWPLVVAGGFALVGVVIGKRSERRNVEAAWFRESRLVSYAALLGAMAELHLATWNLRLGMDPPDASWNRRGKGARELAAYRAAADTAIRKYNHAKSHAELLCAGDIRRATWRFWTATTALRDATYELDAEAMDAAEREVVMSMAHVRNELRADLASSNPSNGKPLVALDADNPFDGAEQPDRR